MSYIVLKPLGNFSIFYKIISELFYPELLNLLQVELINFTLFVIIEISKFQDKLKRKKKIMFVTSFLVTFEFVE